MISFPSRFQKDLSPVYNSRRPEEFYFALYNSRGNCLFFVFIRCYLNRLTMLPLVGQEIYRADPSRW